MNQNQRAKRLQSQIRQLILLRETGPKSAAWHAARARMIWRLHDELKQAEEPNAEQSDEDSQPPAP
jgi:hypothetical protein